MNKETIENLRVQRDYSMDILRILAILIVVFLHISYPFFEENTLNSPQWLRAIIPDTISRWGVPVFVMISGAFMLQKEIPIKVLFNKYIKRLVILLLCWNVIYHIPEIKSMSFSVKNVMSIFFSSGEGYHLWFLYMLIGIYIIIPIIKKIVDGGLTKYVLCLWACTSILFFWFVKSSTFIHLQYYLLNFPFQIDYVGFFILGHYLYSEVKLTKKQRCLIYSLGIFSLACMSLGTYGISVVFGKKLYYFIENLSVFNVLVSVALFVFFRYFDVESCLILSKSKSVIGKLSNLTLGVYLIHIIILNIQYYYFPDDYYSIWNACLAIPAIWVVTTIVCFFISFVLSKIPGLKVLVK
ncbi:MAG: acyltransferase [Candidatus Aphodosoma sp.]